MAARVGRWGMTLPIPGVALSDHRGLVERLGDWGYTDLWTAEVAGADAFTPLAAAATWSPDLRLGTAIASVFARGPALLAMQAAAMADLAPGRFVLGVGSSSPLLVEGWQSGSWNRPYARVRDTLQFLHQALSGERVDSKFETFTIRGFRLERPPEILPSIMVAALLPRMLALAGAESSGALLGLVTPDDVPAMCERVRSAGSSAEIGVRIGVYPTREEAAARQECRAILAAYLNVPTYAALHESLGRGERVARIREAWEAGDRREAVNRVPPEWADAFFAIGPPEACRERIHEFVEKGVTLPILSIMTHESDPARVLAALGPA